MNKIVVFSRRYYPDMFSGTETVIYNVTLELQKYFDTSIVCGWRKDPRLLPLGACAIDLSRTGKLRGYLKMYFMARGYVRKVKPRVILANSIEVPLFKNIPVIAIFHDVNFGEIHKGLLAKLKEKYYQWKLNRVERVIAVSRTSAAQLLRWGIREEAVHVVYSGIDLAHFKPLSSRRSQGKFIVSYPSRIVPAKGQHLLIEAVKKLPEEVRKNLVVWIAGNPQDARYFNQIQELSRGLDVSFRANVPDIAPYYQGADMIAFPTLLEEGFGYTAIEGMACGKPVVYADCPAVIEATGGIGLVFKRGDADQLASKILLLYSDRTMLEEIGRKGRQWVESRYSWEKTGLQYRELIESLC